jgi:hypothetical protein
MKIIARCADCKARMISTIPNTPDLIERARKIAEMFKANHESGEGGKHIVAITEFKKAIA